MCNMGIHGAWPSATRSAWWTLSCTAHLPATAPDAASGGACRFPKLSNVTLAFLESSCRREGIEEWRVYDVVATMRQQKERAQQAQQGWAQEAPE